MSETDDKVIITEVSSGVYVDEAGNQLTDKQVRHVVTPHDFTVDADLVGCTLARPWQRALAILLDLFLIALLASGSLFFVLPIAGYLAWRCHKSGVGRRRNIMLIAMPLLLVVMPFQMEYEDKQPSDFGSALLVGRDAIKISGDNCDLACAEQASDNLIVELSALSIADMNAQETFTELLANSQLPAERQQEKLVMLQQRRAELSAASAADGAAGVDSKPELNWWQKLQQSDNSIIKLLEGILTDLGISIGWAVAYFTLFTSWNNGQTLGKRAFNIRVVQLNKKPLSLWDAFGRQGGYSAGVATGLLGFLQIFWDPNRQAIQDKVANTLVLQLKKNKQ